VAPIHAGCTDSRNPGIGLCDLLWHAEDNLDRLKTLSCDVLDIWPTQDKWINKDVTDKFEKNMASLGKSLTIKPYDADHAFANPSNPKHNKDFTADATKIP